MLSLACASPRLGRGSNGASPVQAIQRSGTGGRASRAVPYLMAAVTTGRCAASRKASGRPAMSTSRSCASVSFSAEASSSFQLRSRSSHATASLRAASGKAAWLVRVCAIAVAWCSPRRTAAASPAAWLASRPWPQASGTPRPRRPAPGFPVDPAPHGHGKLRHVSKPGRSRRFPGVSRRLSQKTPGCCSASNLDLAPG